MAPPDAELFRVFTSSHLSGAAHMPEVPGRPRFLRTNGIQPQGIVPHHFLLALQRHVRELEDFLHCHSVAASFRMAEVRRCDNVVIPEIVDDVLQA